MISPNPTRVFYRDHKLYWYAFILLLVFSISHNTAAQQLAFPTAEGFGKYATGGRGGSVIKVTNLNNSGPGSFREALETFGTRTIVFEVGGIINLSENIYVNNGNVTIAGQTAPGDGILIRGGMVQFSASNIIIRHIRFRPGPSAPSGADALNITAWGGQNHANIIIDHCSMSWASDENFDIRALPNGSVTNVTIQNSIMAECGYGSLAAERTTNLTYHRNLYAHNSERNTRKGYPLPGTFDFELINNLIYGFRYSTVPSMGAKFTVLNNKYKRSSQTNILSGSAVEGTTAGAGQTSQTYAYISGNILESGMSQNNSALSSYLQSTAYASSGIQPISADLLEGELLDNVGASLPSRDGVDVRLINQYINGNGGLATSGSYPTVQNGTAPSDSDNDGMPDTWETENGLNINDPSDRNIVQADGYTNLEYYLNGMTLETLGSQVTVNSDATNNTICEGEDVVLTAANADSYVWDFNGETTETITVSPDVTTTYTVTGTHSDGSTTEAEITITVNEIPLANAGQDIATCQGTPVTLTASGGTSYSWNTNETSPTITVNPNVTTTYSVVVTQNNCSSTDTVTVTVNAIPIVDAGDDVTMFIGDSATLTATGADSYEWSTGETTQSITVNPVLDTSYSVTGTTNGCENSDTITVFLQDDSVNANAGNDTEICNGETTTLTATGGTTYLWSTGETTASISVSPNTTTTYTVTVFSISGANQEDDSVVVTVNDLPAADAGTGAEICSGNATTLTASGGSSYLWSTGETTQTITVAPTNTTTYTVEVFENNCSDSDSVTVTVNPLPNVNAGDDATIVQGDSATLTATGADSYLWSTGETTSSITVTPDATTIFTVTGTLNNGCEADDSVTVTVQSETVNANAGADVSICNGESTTLIATGGVTYLWSTGETTASIDVSPNITTTYSVTAFSASGNTSDEDSVTVTVNEIPVTDAGTDVTISEGESTTLTATGADTYLWNTGETTQSITVTPGSSTTYTVTGFSNNCESSDQVLVIVETINVTANAGTDVTICNGESTTLTATGGTTYLWSTGQTTASITVNPNTTTTYTVTVFNTAQTSSDDDSVTVTVNESPTTDAGVDVTISEGESTTLTATGADTYLWNTGETTQSITVSPSSSVTYTLTGFSNNCEASDQVTVTVEIENVNANAGTDTAICIGESTTLTASGGTTYLWSTGETAASITVNPNTTTTYTVTAFNAAETSSDNDSVVVTVNELPSTNAGNDETILLGNTTTLTATGADTYLWSTGETAASIEVSPNETTIYNVTGFSNGCEFTDEVEISVIFEASAGANQTICQGYSTTLTASEGDAYLWSTGETTQSINVNPSGTQTYTVTVYAGAYVDDADVTVSVNPNPNVVISNGGEVMILEGEFVTLSASGANSYLWNNGATQPNIAVSPSATTTYEVTGFINDCEDTSAIVVNVVEAVVADAGEDLIICSEETVTLTANGGDEYLWNTGETTQSIEVSPDTDTEYSVLVYNALDSDEDTIMVFVEACNTIENFPEDSDEFGFVVYQDPLEDILKVKVNGLQSVAAKGISIYDITGKILYTELFNASQLENQSEMTRSINTSAYARGIYIVRLIYDDTSVLKKIPIR